MYVYVDEMGCIIAFNPNNMSGNTGWEEVQEIIGEPITEEHGVPIYKVQNGHAVGRTAEEIEADIPAPEPPTPDRGMTADARIDNGKYFVIGGSTYKSTTTIPAGDTIIPGTNCTLTNLAEALNALNT